MNLFVFIADAWGSTGGGINCLNHDLAIACASKKKGRENTKICCVVPGLTESQMKEMDSQGVVFINISSGAFIVPEAAEIICSALKKKFRHNYPDRCNTFYIGHDIYTGKLAEQLASEYNGWSVVFHHMDYESYYLFKNPNIGSYTEKIGRQEKILCAADMVCAVGPLLVKSAQDKVRDDINSDVMEFIPGLAEIEPKKKPANRFSPIVFGRVEEDNQCVKQIPLAINAFALAIKQEENCQIIGDNATLHVIGYEADKETALQDEVKRLQQNTQEIAGRLCNVVLQTYQTDRKKLGEQLSRASVVMMLSFHEGFGLVGYEAIAAGVPLILSKNTGLYKFLEREKLDHLVYPVDIKGFVGDEGYAPDDLSTVTRALRDIRQNEANYKEKSLQLCDTLKQDSRYSWDFVAKKFMDGILKQFACGLKNQTAVFCNLGEITKVRTTLISEACADISFTPTKKNHVFSVEGGNALGSLIKYLREPFYEEYTSYLYAIQREEVKGVAVSDFLNSCRSFFGNDGDFKGPEFQYVLGDRLVKTILILNDFPIGNSRDFDELFDILDRDSHDFYIFTVSEAEGPTTIERYNKMERPPRTTNTPTPEPVLSDLTEEQKLLAKVLSFRDNKPYSKKAVSFICNEMNQYREKMRQSAIFTDVTKLEQDVVGLGLVEKYSEFSYQNNNAFISAVNQFDIDDECLALGLSRLGRFYARCYYLSRGGDQQLSWGYFSCKCFSAAAHLSHKIKVDIKVNYESILAAMRKKAMDTSDYSRYYAALQTFTLEYKKPNNPWLWYNLIHCESICGPQNEALQRLEDILRSEFPARELDYSYYELYIQLSRLRAELKYELGISGSLEELVECIEGLPSQNRGGTSWYQCLSTIINLAVGQQKYNLAETYLIQYKEHSKGSVSYQSVIGVALEANLKIIQYRESPSFNLAETVSAIKNAFFTAQDKLKDYRAQGWILGLWGECEMLLDEPNGENRLRKSMQYRQRGREKTKDYHIWLERISMFNLQQDTRTFLDEEIARTRI